MTAALTLEPRLDVAAAEPLTAAIKAHAGSDLVVSARQVTHIGTPCLQVLLSAVKTWKANENTFTMTEISVACKDQLDVFGLTGADFSTGEDHNE